MVHCQNSQDVKARCIVNVQYQKPAAAATGYGGGAAGAASSYGSRSQASSGYGQQSGGMGSYGAGAAAPAASGFQSKVSPSIPV